MNRLGYRLLCFVLGGLYGWIGDGGHVLSSVLEYPRADRWWWPGLAWWVLPQFAAGGLLLSWLVTFAYSRAGRPTLAADFPDYTKGIIAVVFSLTTYLQSSVLTLMGFNDEQISLILIALTGLLGVFLRVDRSLPTFASIGIAVGVGGIAWESSLCAIKAFRYVEPDLQYVNHWICWLWIGAVWATVFPMWRFEATQHHAAATERVKKAT